VSTRPRPEDFPTWWSYRHAARIWKARHGGSLFLNIVVAVIAGGITGSRVAVVLFVVLAVLVTLARRHSEPPTGTGS
jgi:TRAP-type C4-dicarboxylate transport system permease large subunit